jgi:hypothetical protein
MTELKDKVITMESLAMVHAYNQSAYMPKINNVFTLVDLNDDSLQYNPNDFISFILEIADADNGMKQIVFTNRTVNNDAFDVKAQSSLLDEDGDIFLYELYFYLENDKYIVKPTLTKIVLLTGTRTLLNLSYNKLYGVKIV